MSAYRFCRTDDMTLLVDALNRCWAPYVPGEPHMTLAAFKRSIRDLQVWCSSCMVAFSGSDPIGVLIGAKRASATLVHRIAVHPDHRRQGHGGHLLASLGAKLAILGPPRIVAEVPEAMEAAIGLFSAGGYVREALLTDYILVRDADVRAQAAIPAGGNGWFVVPVTVDDLAANGLLEEAHPQVCWQRSAETLTARKDDIAGLAAASEERIEACILYMKRDYMKRDGSPADATAGADRQPGAPAAEIVSLRSYVDDGGARLKQLLGRLGTGTFLLPKVHPAEASTECLERLGFRAAGRHLLYTGRARPEQA